MKTVYAKDLGKCYARDGNYRLYKEGNIYALYSVGKELIWEGDDYRVGRRLEAILIGYVQHLTNFETVVAQCKRDVEIYV